MDKTDDRNAVLLYVAMKDKQLVLFGDEGIYNATGPDFWNNAVKEMISNFTKEDVVGGIIQCILAVGKTLHEKFPYNKDEDKNELPDEIVFGK
jgi:uncharacterized membrane protein